MKIFRCGILVLSLFTLAALPGCSPLDANGETVPNDGGESPADPTIFKSSADSPFQATVTNSGTGETLNVNATVRLPQLDEMPQAREVALQAPHGTRRKVAGPKPVVRVYHLSGSCPAFNRFQTWHYNLTQQQRESFPVLFAPATIDDSLPCPTFHFQTPSGGWYYVHGWTGPDEFLRQYYMVSDTLDDGGGSPPRSCNCGPDCQCCPGCSCGGAHGPYGGQTATQSAPMSASCSSGSCGVSGVRMKGGKRR